MSLYDTIITGGHVIDPASGLSAVADVAIKNGKIAKVAPGLSAGDATNIINAAGQYVTPGLIDLHTHVYWGATYWGIEPDPVAARSGVTTWLDVGSAGGYTLPGFRRCIVEPANRRYSPSSIISSIGLIAPTWELSNLDYCDVDLAEMIVNENRDLIMGSRPASTRSTTRGTGIEPLRRARELADQVDLPLMIHIGAQPPPSPKSSMKLDPEIS